MSVLVNVRQVHRVWHFTKNILFSLRDALLEFFTPFDWLRHSRKLAFANTNKIWFRLLTSFSRKLLDAILSRCLYHKKREKKTKYLSKLNKNMTLLFKQHTENTGRFAEKNAQRKSMDGYTGGCLFFWFSFSSKITINFEFTCSSYLGTKNKNSLAFAVDLFSQITEYVFFIVYASFSWEGVGYEIRTHFLSRLGPEQCKRRGFDTEHTRPAEEIRTCTKKNFSE